MTTPLTNVKLTGRERVNRMFERRDHDRTPRHDTFWTDTIERWRGEGLDGDDSAVLDLLGSDFHNACWYWPAPFADETVLEEDEQTKVVRDRQGKTVRLWKHRMGTPEHLDFGCQSRDDWEQQYKPRLLERGVAVDVPRAIREYHHARERNRWAYLAGIEGFEATRALVGDEIAMIAMAEDPEWIKDISDTYAELSIRSYQAIIDAGAQPDGLWTYGDMAFNHATMCSPAMYRELILPGHRRLCDFAHTHGMKFIYHTDGNVNGVIDIYLEAGFDCLQPLEAKADMDIRTLCPRYGDRLAFFGNIDVMVMATNDREVIEAEIVSKFAAGMATRGYAYHSDHSVPPSVNWDTYRFIIDCVEKHGSYD